MNFFRDCYSEEIIDTQGVLFEMISCEDIDFCKFITDYMNSNVRKQIDRRNPILCNYLAPELIEELKKEMTFKKGNGFDFMLANWVGEFYARLQDYSGVSSKAIIKRFPAESILRRCGGLHDYDLGLVVKKMIDNN